MLSNIFILLTNLWKNVSGNLINGSPETDKQTKRSSGAKKSVFDNISIDGARIGTDKDMMKFSINIKLVVLDSLNELASTNTGPITADVVPKNSVGNWTPSADLKRIGRHRQRCWIPRIL